MQNYKEIYFHSKKLYCLCLYRCPSLPTVTIVMSGTWSIRCPTLMTPSCPTLYLPQTVRPCWKSPTVLSSIAFTLPACHCPLTPTLPWSSHKDARGIMQVWRNIFVIFICLTLLTAVNQCQCSFCSASELLLEIWHRRATFFVFGFSYYAVRLC